MFLGREPCEEHPGLITTHPALFGDDLPQCPVDVRARNTQASSPFIPPCSATIFLSARSTSVSIRAYSFSAWARENAVDNRARVPDPTVG
ncbi:hypothetical protein [Corynebacterium terpenotabidum]|uniref:Uncharacterized protein n=1 Tax=Corynebacterium terpenotabidum Y-11 TaxID=1200352 RepID=S4XIM1_9CORY|nr:hypothetical protein [Corynebacterium terpenotabidum]AGP31575.1 hypothetical protein A606_09680 [Corynebacterium terpenotabidum Y-11]